MGRNMKYPELLELKIGESLYIPRDEITTVQNVRNIVHNASKRTGLTFIVSDRWREGHVEVARVADDRRVGSHSVGASSFQTQPMTREEMSARMREISAQLNEQE